MDDVISRRQAIDAVNCVMIMKGIRSGKSVAAEAIESVKSIIADNIRQLPSAQPTFDARDTQYNLPIGTDLISRQQAIDALAEDMPSAYTLDGSHPADEGIFMAREIYADCIQTLKELPSAEPKRIRGKWIHDGGKWKNRWICSECGYKWFFDCIEGAFCPHCGADMRNTT